MPYVLRIWPLAGSADRLSCRSHWPFRPLRTHSCLRSQQLPTHRPQVGEREQRMQLRGVLAQAPVAHLHMPELALDHAERVLHLRSHAGLELLNLLDALVVRIRGIELPSFARAHRDLPPDTLACTRPLGSTLVASIRENHRLLAMQQAV